MTTILSHCAIHGRMKLTVDDVTLVVAAPGASFLLHGCPQCRTSLCERHGLHDGLVLDLLDAGVQPAWDLDLEFSDLTDGAS